MALEPPERHAPHSGLGAYAASYVALLVLTVATFLVAKVDLGPWNILAAMGIACTKAVVVVVVFMHLKDHGATNRAYFLAGLFFICLLIGLLLTDLFTRPIPTRPHDPSHATAARGR